MFKKEKKTMHITLRTVPPKILARQVIILNKRGIQTQTIHILPLALFCKRKDIRLDRSSHTLNAIRSRSNARVEQSDHVVTCLSVGKHGLIGNVLEEAEGKGLCWC